MKIVCILGGTVVPPLFYTKLDSAFSLHLVY